MFAAEGPIIFEPADSAVANNVTNIFFYLRAKTEYLCAL
jgi:hypothetical protein